MLKLVLFATLLVYVYASVDQAVVCLKKGEIDGKVTFKKTADGIKVEGTINGLPAGKHGFHIHEKGDLGDNCKAAGGHFNPTKKNHGAPEDADRHVGDLGNIIADDKKVANVNIIDKIIALDGDNSIIGRALVIHEGEDDLGKGGFDDSNTTGHAGARLVCGVVGIVNETMLGEELCPGGVPDVAVSTTGSYFLLFTTVYLTIQYYFN